MQDFPGDHAAHDLVLLAALAAGDATGPNLARAEALVARCEACATLVADLFAIAAALAELPASARPRDFRLTSADAARLQPRGVRGLLAGLAAPRFAFATPVGTGLAALGIVGVLVASGGSAAGGAGSAPTTQDRVVLQYAAPEPGAPESAAPVLSEGPAGGTRDGGLVDAGTTPIAVPTSADTDPLLVASALLVLAGGALVVGRAGARRLG